MIISELAKTVLKIADIHRLFFILFLLRDYTVNIALYLQCTGTGTT